MKQLENKELFTFSETIASSIFEGTTYPWEVLPKISDFILSLGATLPAEEYEKRGENVWIAKTAKVAPTACIIGPVIIDENAEITEMGRMVREAISTLPPKERTVVEYRFYRNMQVKDIAIQIGLSPSRVTRIVQSSLNTIKEYLNSHEQFGY